MAEAIEFPCDVCGAAAGSPCMSDANGQPLGGVHGARLMRTGLQLALAELPPESGDAQIAEDDD